MHNELSDALHHKHSPRQTVATCAVTSYRCALRHARPGGHHTSTATYGLQASVKGTPMRILHATPPSTIILVCVARRCCSQTLAQAGRARNLGTHVAHAAGATFLLQQLQGPRTRVSYATLLLSGCALEGQQVSAEVQWRQHCIGNVTLYGSLGGPGVGSAQQGQCSRLQQSLFSLSTTITLNSRPVGHP
jgi:hypothetical protein